MKKIILCVSLLFCCFVFSQNKTDKKFLVSLHYIGNAGNKYIVNNEFNGLVGIDVRYNFYKNQKLSLTGGINLDYLQENSFFFENDALVFNPNIGVEINIFKAKLKPFFNLGYSFFSYKRDFDTFFGDEDDPAFTSSIKDNFQGISLNPGLRLYFTKTFFAEASYKFIIYNSSYFDESANTHYFQIGLGIKL